MSPERFEDLKYDNKVDIWAIGLIYHYLLFSRPYFKGNNDMLIMKEIIMF